MTNYPIPLHKPFWDKSEENAAIDALRQGTGVGDLSYSEELSKILRKKLSVSYALPTNSGTAALELACDCILKKGDEVILPSFTFSSCANAVLLSGATPVFCDIDISTYNIDPAEIERKITKKTKAVMVVHYAGFSCNMDQIKELCRKHKLQLIEDAAHALGAKYKGVDLGTIGDIGCYSFHGTKNIACGEGGAFVTNTKSANNLAEIIREKGTDRSAFMRGEKKKYSWIKVGKSLILSDILSAIALEQVKKIEKITQLRRKNAQSLLGKLKGFNPKIVLPVENQDIYSNWHIFAIRVPKKDRDAIINNIRSMGVEVSFHYLPLHNSVMGKKLGYKTGDFPTTEEVSSTLIRLPMYPSLSEKQISHIAKSVLKAV